MRLTRLHRSAPVEARAWLRRLQIMLAAVAGTLLIACTTTPPGQTAASRAADESAMLARLHVRDLRAEYGAALCARLPAGSDCAKVLRDLPGTPRGAATTRSATDAPAALARRFRLAFVPGLLAGCGGPATMPFADTLPALRDLGFDARMLAIEGRGATELNGELIARQLQDAGADPRPWIVFGYSKGLPDVLEALVRHPTLGRDIAAVVSYAGAVGGSRLAEDAGPLPATLLEHVPLPGCRAGDGSAVASLRRGQRQAWWQAHQAELHVPFYALVAAAEPDRVSVPLRSAYATLSGIDPLNDGQLLATDALVPGGALLGYVNADHWAIAMALSRLPVVGGLFTDDLPRTDLIVAAIQVIARHTAVRTHASTARP